MSTSFTRKSIEITIALDVDGAANRFTFSGYAVNVSVSKSGGVEFSKAAVEIYGLPLDKMAQLTTLAWKPLNRRWNALEIRAGEGENLAVIFTGEITISYADLNGGSPVLRIEAQSGSYHVLVPDPQIALSGSQDVGGVMNMLAQKAGLQLENAGVSGSLSDCVLTGDPVTKMRQVADQIGADFFIDDGRAVLMPRGGVRAAEGSIPVVSADTGMIGYPTFTSQGIQAATYFNPALRIGANVKIESIVPSASGVWKIVSLTHELSANNPNASAWSTSFSGIWIE